MQGGRSVLPRKTRRKEIHTRVCNKNKICRTNIICAAVLKTSVRQRVGCGGGGCPLVAQRTSPRMCVENPFVDRPGPELTDHGRRAEGRTSATAPSHRLRARLRHREALRGDPCTQVRGGTCRARGPAVWYRRRRHHRRYHHRNDAPRRRRRIPVVKPNPCAYIQTHTHQRRRLVNGNVFERKRARGQWRPRALTYKHTHKRART